MIKSFKHKGLEELFTKGRSKRIGADVRAKLLRQLAALDAATTPRDMNLPGWVLHEYTHAEKGKWSVKVNGNMRLIFRWRGTDAEDVDFEDPH